MKSGGALVSGVWTYSTSTEIKETRSVVFTSMLTYRRERGGSPLDARRWSKTLYQFQKACTLNCKKARDPLLFFIFPTGEAYYLSKFPKVINVCICFCLSEYHCVNRKGCLCLGSANHDFFIFCLLLQS